MANDAMPFGSRTQPSKEVVKLQKYDELYNEVNTLLRFLDGGPKTVADCVDDFYLYKFGNSAPGELLRKQIKIVQKHLDNAE